MDTHRGLIDTHDLVHILVDRQKQSVALRQLIAVLRLGGQQRPLVFRQSLLELRDARPKVRRL